jgi:hypothetical protein
MQELQSQLTSWFCNHTLCFLEVSHRGVATTGKVLHHIDFILDFFGAGGLYWSLAFLLNLLDNLLTVSQTTSWESLA